MVCLVPLRCARRPQVIGVFHLDNNVLEGLSFTSTHHPHTGMDALRSTASACSWEMQFGVYGPSKPDAIAPWGVLGVHSASACYTFQWHLSYRQKGLQGLSLLGGALSQTIRRKNEKDSYILGKLWRHCLCSVPRRIDWVAVCS